MSYMDFLRSKMEIAPVSGFDVDPSEINPALYDWQRDITRWALRKGKACLFEDCGHGKTIQQLEFARKVCEHTGGDVLILAPLAVAAQTAREGEKFGIEVNICEDQDDVKPGINITNYEKLHRFDAESFVGIVLDESSVLKDFTSATRNELIDRFKKTPYRLCCSATPSPNDYAEIGNHAEFLGIMTRTEMLSTFFVHDGGDTSKWRLKGHAVKAFFEWVASWACCITSPADIGYDGSGFVLPPLNVVEHVVKSGQSELDDGQISIIGQPSMTLSERRRARKDSLDERVELAADIANAIDGQCLIWCDLNSESEALSKAIKNSVEVRGSDSNEHKKNSMMGFSDGTVQKLISKPSIAGWGMNWQNCHEMIFVGLSDSFEAYYQAIRRCWRYGQKNPVTVHIVISENEGAVKANIERKQAENDAMKRELISFTRESLEADIRQTGRITETYFATERMVLPRWIA